MIQKPSPTAARIHLSPTPLPSFALIHGITRGSSPIGSPRQRINSARIAAIRWLACGSSIACRTRAATPSGWPLDYITCHLPVFFQSGPRHAGPCLAAPRAFASSGLFSSPRPTPIEFLTPSDCADWIAPSTSTSNNHDVDHHSLTCLQSPYRCFLFFNTTIQQRHISFQ